MSNIEKLIEIDRILGESFTSEGMIQWWRRPRPELNGQSPGITVAGGEIDLVYQLALSLQSGNFT